MAGEARKLTSLESESPAHPLRRALLCAVPLVCCTTAALAGTFTYQVDVQILYDVVDGGVTYPDTPVWGMPSGTGYPSGALTLLIDNCGNVTGSSGTLYGQRLHSYYNFSFALAGGSWGAPVAKVAPLTNANVSLDDTFLGDFAGLTIVSGFLEDGNSGDVFNLANGVGLDGKLEWTVTGPDGMSMTYHAKGTNAGAGTGWYTFAFDGAALNYNKGGTTAYMSARGVVPHAVWIDAAAHTFWMPTDIAGIGDFVVWYAYGRTIDSFGGTIDSAGTFAGSAHYAGVEFVSLTAATTNGAVQDSNSTGFDAGNGLVPGDTLNVVLTAGPFDLVIQGTLISQTLAGDLNCDGLIDGQDIYAFLLAMLDPAGYASSFFGCDIENGDFDCDWTVDSGDVPLFVSALLAE